MNYYLLVSGIIAISATIGHFAMGYKSYLQPVLNSDIDKISKNVMISLFHYMSVFMVITTVFLVGMSFGNNMGFSNNTDVIRFIGTTYLGFAIAQFIIALRSSVEKGALKMFQWIFWLLISLFALLSVYA